MEIAHSQTRWPGDFAAILPGDKLHARHGTADIDGPPVLDVISSNSYPDTATLSIQLH